MAARVRCPVDPAGVWPLLADPGRWLAGAGVAVTVEVVSRRPPHVLTYRVVAGLPVREDTGTVELVPVAGGTDICWSHRFRPRIPGTGGFLRTRLETQTAEAATRLAAAASVR